MKDSFKHTVRLLCVVTGLVGAGASVASPNTSWEGVVALQDTQLDAMRGGFLHADGLRMSLSWVRTMRVNGEMVQQSRFDMADSAGAASNPTVNAGVIQNSLNNQQISTLTEIHTSVNSLGLMKSLNAGAVLRESLLDSLTNR